ncbi:carboxypeptidase regulatory-like domain protein [Leptospira ellinghausenii]|uniref:Carboxypeptidase regulatory-like domain protein n=1 Tax=Leptospira ellinghausenii TaxID=1917822 RepID=A0A2P2DFX4_9LEPT|nr:carboxypeptidase regulatory-like domain protein [Leptospira ellinghausenii]
MKSIKTLLTISLLVFISIFGLSAQSNGSIRGTIIDSENGEPVFGATIVIRSEKNSQKLTLTENTF